MSVMKLLILLTIFNFLNGGKGFAQQTDTSECSKLSAIVGQMKEWRKNYTIEKYPVESKRPRPKLGHSFLDKETAVYYSSSATFTNEYLSEFGIDDNGKCFYMVYFGPYTIENIDKEGKRWKEKFLSCINLSDWQVSDIPDVYLQISYNLVDIAVSILKIPIKGTNNFNLVLSMFRFTPIK
jgi:hypothetical protein